MNELIGPVQPAEEFHRDPVIAAKQRAVRRMVEMATLFKRVDIELLQMKSPHDPLFPAFAVQSLEDYERGLAATYDGGRQCHVVNNRPMFRDVMSRSGLTTGGTATPSGSIPGSARATVDAHRSQFDELIIVWDASKEWVGVTENSAITAGADPLILGGIDGVWFKLAAWDLTKLESYFAD